MISTELVDLSRLQFAATAMYHYLFVPLTLGLSMLLVAMEACYVVTGKQVYKDMVKFWGKLFGINFALGVTTGITMEFQFGTNWSYYSHYVGDISAPRWRLKVSWPSSWSPPSSAFSSSAGLALRRERTFSAHSSWLWALTSPLCGFWSPTAGCRTRSVPPLITRPCEWR